MMAISDNDRIHDSLHDGGNDPDHDILSTTIATSTSTLQLSDTNRPHSIDMAFELERQLESDEEHDFDHENITPSSSDLKDRHVSLDPQVLSGLVANLRQALEVVTRERDQLCDVLAETHAKEAELKEALSLITDRAANLETEVADLRKKSQDDDEAIQLLRSKVEESRRGLMRLQTENRRASQMSTISLDTNRANTFFGNPPPSGKRTSFTPLTGSGAVRIQPHRRTSSVSESAFGIADADSPSIGFHVSPNSRIVSLPEEGAAELDDSTKKSRRTSGIFVFSKGTPSPPSVPRQLSPEPAGLPHDHFVAQIDLLTKERDVARSELEVAQRELVEAQEAREASENCVLALRTFISEQAIGETGSTGTLKLPPLPTERSIDEENTTRKPTGWSLKLWRVDTSTSSGSRSSGPDSSVVSPVGETSSTPGTAIATNPPSSISLSKKLGGFFGARMASASIPTPHSHQQEPILNGSDCSSIDEPAEPVSPEARDQMHSIVLVRESSQSTSSEITSSIGTLPEKITVPLSAEKVQTVS